MSARPIACAIAAVLLSACASMPPSREAGSTAQAAIAADWPSDIGQNTPEGISPIPAWETFFTDPRLQDLIRTALANNHDLQLATLRIQEAQAAYRIQRADQLPTIGINADHTRAGIPDAYQPLLGSSVAEGNVASVGFSSWELDLWGRVRNLKRAALQNYLATSEAQRAVQISLIEQVANQYLTLCETDERIALTELTIQSRADSFHLFKRRLDVGSISRLQLTQVETLLVQAQAIGAQLKQQRAAQAHALQVLLGTPGDSLSTTPGALAESTFTPLAPGLPSGLLTQRPDLMAYEHKLQASRANVAAARAAFFPTISLTGLAGSASPDLSNLFDSGTGTWLFRPNLVLPIFDSGRRRANLSLNRARESMAVVGYEKAVQTAFREVSDALSSRTWLTEQVNIQQHGVDVLSERARLATLRYEAGSTAYLDVLDAQRDLLSAQQQLISAQRALATSHVALYAALGGGQPTPNEPTAR